MPNDLSPQEHRTVAALEAARSFLADTAKSCSPDIAGHMRAAIKAIDVAADKLPTPPIWSFDLVRRFLLDAAEMCPDVAHPLGEAIRELDQAEDKLPRVGLLSGATGPSA